ncbi:hypothetical protein C488_18995 [Natrinema pellirubrum DSM 15624]|uniref:Uncharacterized protein n=1 Tax=Natrinema pellirubrum (strain DSM 15624 / CIP 106293 / JCM 10476 / NCIMB 786 / 157) TaxID=797303 RepID=L0JFB5_NATP1|nr:DUF5828 family protein [Natrinema pellirubrum]AGB29989.1 hypothetical protein Natpe_0038 [Natrinema pellirubrum DSM 15624]ELY70531.1 hypothetical protein C488_18995 [Natrinema pellirubrum DSM 15624]ELZ15876.1 hypothetical protein C478_04039 [Natrinema thermotolerans DSM 11552]
MEESISGFKVRGDWGDIVEHGERITRALRDVDVHDPDQEWGARFARAFEEWDEWRPKAHETLDSDVSEKTADQASVEEGKGEKAGKEPDEDIKTAGEKLSESYESLEDDDAGAAVDNWKESIDYVARAADSASRKALRRVEDTVYQNVMTQLAPYYFDNELVSANVQQSTRNGGNGEQFVFEVNVNDDDLKEAVSERLAEYEDEIDRWHVEVEKDTDAAEAIEGAEPPPEPDDNSRSTTN